MTTSKKKKMNPVNTEQTYPCRFTSDMIGVRSKINEILTCNRAEFLGIPLCKDIYKHPELEGFRKAQWGSIHNAIRMYGASTVIAVITDNKWCCDPKYNHKYPLYMKKIVERLEQAKIQETLESNEVPPNSEQQDFIASQSVRDFSEWLHNDATEDM